MASTLVGHIVASEIFMGVALFLLGYEKAQRGGYLTVSYGWYLAFLAGALSAAFGMTFWLTFTRPLLKRRKGRRDP
jgi:hypothetical protein